jgi:malonyl-CoA decarboxylase
MLAGLKTAAQTVGQVRTLRAVLIDCRRLLSERGDANSSAIASELVEHFGRLGEARQLEFFDHLARDFGPAPEKVLACAQAYAAQPTAENLMHLTQASEPPRQELFRRINRVPGGTATIVAMRRTLLQSLRKRPELRAVEADLLHLLSSWFNPGFLEVQKVDWGSPARLLEKLIEHEAVHAIDGWRDLRRRLELDRRCFAFFHPLLPGEPLIFVEVALLSEMPAAIAPLIDKRTAPLQPEQFKVAAFYSISNCQPGLRGVSLGNFLIKRVAEQLRAELPQLKVFCTLSPIPGFAAWLDATTDFGYPGITPRAAAGRLPRARALVVEALHGTIAALTSAAPLRAMSPKANSALLRLAATYLMHASTRTGGDPVARFHLANGARLERINPLGDLSHKGLRQSCGLMVNYLYDLQRIEANHEKFIRGEVPHARAVAALI